MGSLPHMARPKEFDRDEALDRALDVFWTKGFEATTVQDLVGATGVQRQSLYDTFGDKTALYLAALDRYSERTGERARALERPTTSPIALLRQTFVQAAEEAASGAKGCMVVAAAQELGGHSPMVRDCVQASIQRWERAFTTLVKHAQAVGEVPASVDAEGAARTLVTLLWGFRAMTHGGSSEAWLRSVVDSVLGLLAPAAS